ncbi:MAG: hypothetical protein RL317_908 [Pseudomonadota bacterium]
MDPHEAARQIREIADQKMKAGYGRIGAYHEVGDQKWPYVTFVDGWMKAEAALNPPAPESFEWVVEQWDGFVNKELRQGYNVLLWRKLPHVITDGDRTLVRWRCVTVPEILLGAYPVHVDDESPYLGSEGA